MGWDGRGWEEMWYKERDDAPLAGGLEEEPLELVDLVLGLVEGELVRRVVLLDEVRDYRVRLPAVAMRVSLRTGRRYRTWSWREGRIGSGMKPRDEVLGRGQNSPDGEVAVLVVDEGRDAAVGVVLGMRLSLLLALAEVEVDRLVVESELLEHDHHLPMDPGHLSMSTFTINEM